VGKYIQLRDAYLSVVEALRHAVIAGWRPYCAAINAEDLETEGAERY